MTPAAPTRDAAASTPVIQGLWPHQDAAVRAACNVLATGGRASVVAACGAGKTRTAAEVSRRLAPAGPVLVVVPTLDLLAQTIGAYLDWLGPAAGQIVAVCGDAGAAGDALEMGKLAGVSPPVTTDPGRVATLAGSGGRVTVVCTYTSLPVIAAAHRRHGLRPWELVVADEAHRSAGHGAKPWAVIHWDAHIPAARRLYLTATPRIMGETGGQETVSMDDAAIFGPIVHETTFAQAIAAGLLADYRVVVALVTSAEVAKLTAGSAVLAVAGRALPARMVACQVALARAIRQWDLRRVITYHGRVARAVRFAATLPATLQAMDLGERPERPVAADFVTGSMTTTARRQRLAVLAEPGSGTAVLSNARVLAEGVDVPELDAILLADPKDSDTDVVQAVGRVLRRGAEPGKVATIIVPVLTSESSDPAQALGATEYATVWRVVRALRAHDERIASWLDTQRAELSRDNHEPTTGPPPWLHVSGIPVTPAFTAAITVRAITAASTSWPQYLAALDDYRAAHGHANPPGGYHTSDGLALGTWLGHQRIAYHAGQLAPGRAAELEQRGVDWERRTTTWWRKYQYAAGYRAAHGHLNVPHNYRASDGFALGSWIACQRKDQREGKLAPDRVTALEKLGIIWDPLDTAWKRGLAHATDYHTSHGHLYVPTGYRTPDGFALFSWLNDQCKHHKAGKLPQDRTAALEKLGIIWDRHGQRWQTGLEHLIAFQAIHGHVRVPANYRSDDGFTLYNWLTSQRSAYRRGRLPLDRTAALEKLGVTWEDRSDHWQAGLEHLHAFHTAHGHVKVPAGYRSDDGFALYTWLITQRTAYRKDRLPPERAATLRAAGWDPANSPNAGPA
jgi:superfamily II DNA or RNA helicase